MALGASFTWLEAALVVLGAAVAARRVPWFFWCTLLTFALAGPGFALMANMDPVRPPTALWVLRRFFLLPHVVLAPLAAFGVESIVRAVQDGARSRRLVSAAVACTLMIVLVVGVVRNYPVIDQRRNHLARTFAEDILVSLEPRSVLLASGDEVLFPLAYLQAVEHERPDVTVVAVGFLWRYEWYLEVLRRRDPHLRVPFEWSDVGRPSATLEALVKANADRPFAFVGEPEDDGSLRDVWFFRRGLVAQLEPWQREVSLEAFVAENERLLRLYRVPDAGAIKHKTFEDSILARYAHVAVTVGRRYALTYPKHGG